MSSEPPHIGTLRETALHAALKQYCARPGDEIEARVGGHVADLRRGDLLIEIQTQNFAAFKRKIARLLDDYRVRVVHPIAVAKWITRVSADGEKIGRRKSPRRGELADIFLELVSLAALLSHRNFSLEVLLIHEEEIRTPAKPSKRRRRWKKEWRTHDRRLLEVVEWEVFESPADYAHRFLPAGLPQPFTNRALAKALGQPAFIAQKITYCFQKMGLIEAAGKKGRAKLFQRVPPSAG
jgi:hypothetical protein